MISVLKAAKACTRTDGLASGLSLRIPSSTPPSKIILSLFCTNWALLVTPSRFTSSPNPWQKKKSMCTVYILCSFLFHQLSPPLLLRLSHASPQLPPSGLSDAAHFRKPGQYTPNPLAFGNPKSRESRPGTPLKFLSAWKPKKSPGGSLKQ